MRGKPYPRDTIRAFFRLVHTAGMDTACAQAGVPKRTGLYWLRMGQKRVIEVAAVKRGRAPNAERDARVREALAAGVSQSEIARIEKVTRQMVSLIVRRLNGRSTNGKGS